MRSKIFSIIVFVFYYSVSNKNKYLVLFFASIVFTVFISYKGDRAGAIILIVSAETAKILAYNILGIDEDEEDLPFESSMDALKELLNTICGQFITSRYGDEPVFDLTVPETKIISLDEWQESVDSGNFLSLNVEDEPILIKSLIE